MPSLETNGITEVKLASKTFDVTGLPLHLNMFSLETHITEISRNIKEPSGGYSQGAKRPGTPFTNMV